MKRTIFSTLLAALALMPSAMVAQRMQQPLGRGVVAVYGTSNGSAGVEITWRRLAQEPENIRYNVYVDKAGDGQYVLINDKPLANTNYATTLAKVPYGSRVAVGVDGLDGKLSKPFHFKNNGLRNVYMEINYAKSGSPLNSANYTTKFVWPCDLNGDGEYDYVVDRCPVDGTRNFYVEGYLADGTFLWNIDLGVNERPCDGQNDNMCAYDIDCDGKGELIVQTSDGSRFWDNEAKTWGKYVFGKATGDTDGDGIIDYDTQGTKNPPRYMTVVDGMTGAEKASVEFKYDDAYNRTNKAQLMGDEYNKHEAHVGIFYHDGVHPAICGEWLSRDTNKAHHYRNCAFAYDFDANGNATNWHQLFMKNIGGAEFHMIRIFDADGDGKDEMSSGAYVMDHDGSTLYNTGISHGDRHRTSDIDPEHPGLETFSIQQNAGDMLGMILFDAGTGEPLKKWYLPAVGDVGRGECMDLDPNHLGWEMFSTMDGYQMYDAKGNKIEGKFGYFPTEGLWWDGQLDRERVDTPDGNGYNAMIVDYNNGRLIEMAKEANWTLKSTYGKRGKYWGDIIGDWREELILIREENGVCQGIVGFSTDYSTSVNNIYCLQEDPHYRGDCTTRGYYQTPCPGFYLGYDMPRPQLPPCMVANDTTDVFGIADGDSEIVPRDNVKTIYAMPVKGQTLTVNRPLDWPLTLWKSQQGTLVVNCDVAAAKTPSATDDNSSNPTVIISEGTVRLGGTYIANVDLRARGTLAGSGTVGSITLEGALHYEGCRLMPESQMTIEDKVVVPVKKRLYIELMPGKDRLTFKNGIDLKGTIAFNLPNDLPAGVYGLVEGCESIDLKKVEVRGLKGKSYSFKLVAADGGEQAPSILTLTVNDQRDAAEGVVWTGANNGTWDYKAENFSIDGEPTYFVAGDAVVFNDEAVNTTITLNEMMPVSTATFASEKKSYVINGIGGIEGKTILQSGKLTVKEPQNYTFEIGKATLVINNTNSGTDKVMTLTDTATISIASGNAALKGKISGDGVLVKDGAGQVNITYAGTNAWAGTILKAGTLAMGAWNTTFGKSTSPIHVMGNSTITMFNCNSTSTIPSVQNVITIDKGKTLTFHAGQRCAVKGTLKGEGTFKIDFPYVRGDVSTNCSQFEGTYQVTTSNCRFVQAMDMSKATLQLDADSYAAGYTGGSGNETSYTHKIGSISGTGTLGTGTWNIGYLGKDDTFAGTFNSAAAVGKYGDGTLYINGKSEGTVTVYAGLLAGTGTLKNVTVKKDAMIGAGKGSVTLGTLTLNGTLTVNAEGKMRLRYRTSSTKTTCDAYNVAGNIKLTSPVIETSQLGTNEISDNAELQVFTGEGKITISGDVTVIPATPKQGWKWDTSTLATDGKLRIVEDPTAIKAIDADDATSAIYDLQGRKVENPSRGIYIIDSKKVQIK